MKKLLSFALVLVMALAFCSPIFAADNAGVLIATDFKDKKTQFIPLNLGVASANIVTVGGDECLYIATMNSGANNWLAYPLDLNLSSGKNYVIAFDVAVPELADGTTSGTVKMKWSAIVQGAGDFASAEANRMDIEEVSVPVGTWKHVELTFAPGLDFGAFGFSDWTTGDNKNVNADFYIDNLIICEGSEYQEVKKNYTERSGKANAPDGYLVCNFSGNGVLARPANDTSTADPTTLGGYYNYKNVDYEGNGCFQLKPKSALDELGFKNQEFTVPFNPVSGKTYVLNFRLRFNGYSSAQTAADNTKLEFYLTNGTAKQSIGTSTLPLKEWVDVSYEFTVDGSFTDLALLEEKVNDLNGCFQFDDLKITEKKASTDPSADTSDTTIIAVAVFAAVAAGACLTFKKKKSI